MVRIEELSTDDFTDAVHLANTMNWNMTTADFEFNKSLEPHGCFALRENSKLVGIATCISYCKVGWFGNLIVEESHRKQGSGTLLVKHALCYLKKVGVTTVGLYAYTHLVNFYSKIGFRPDKEFIYLKGKVSFEMSQEKKDNLKRPSQKDIPKIVRLDERCFGSSRKKLFQSILKDEETICLVSEEGRDIAGFVIANSYKDSAEIGPLVCNKTRPEIAGELLKAAFDSVNKTIAYICLPVSEINLLKAVSNYDFAEEFRITRMFLGPPIQTDCTYIAESLERG